MAEERWNSVAVPLIEAVADLPPLMGKLKVVDLAEQVGVDVDVVGAELERLIEAKFLGGTIKKAWDPGARSWIYVGPSLEEKGARVAGMWPPEDLLDRLYDAIEQRIEEEPDEDKKSRLRGFGEALLNSAHDVGTEVVAAVIVQAGRGGL